MANMSYCRFQNTYRDLSDCYSALDDFEDVSEREREYAERLYNLCKEYVDEYERIVEL